MGAPSIPNTYYLYPDVSGGMDIGLENVAITGLPLVKLEGTVKSIPKIVTDDTVTIKSLPKIVTDSTLHMGLDDIRVKELPKIQLELSVSPTRIHYPGHYKLCAAIFGVEVFSLALCGESMAIAEPYVPRKTETCH
jgi:hypothetical protein